MEIDKIDISLQKSIGSGTSSISFSQFMQEVEAKSSLGLLLIKIKDSVNPIFEHLKISVFIDRIAHPGNYGCQGGGGFFTGIRIAILHKSAFGYLHGEYMELNNKTDERGEVVDSEEISFEELIKNIKKFFLPRIQKMVQEEKKLLVEKEELVKLLSES